MSTKKNMSTFLTCLGAAGVIATTITAVKATPKAMRLLEEAEKEKGEELTKTEMVKTAAPAFIPTLAIGVGTIISIFGANILNKRSQAALMSSYALLDSSYREYTKKVKKLYGEDSESKIKEEIAKDQYEENDVHVDDGKQLFFDFATLEYFEANMNDVIQKVVMDDGLECYIITMPFN